MVTQIGIDRTETTAMRINRNFKIGSPMMGMGVWDYSHLPGNLWGQVCPQFAALWCVVSGPAIVLLDWMRYAVRGGQRPHYIWICPMGRKGRKTWRKRYK